MDIKSTKDMLIDAKNKQYAIGAFNVENMEMIKAVLDAADKYKTPLIIASSTNALKYVDPIVISSIVKAFLSDKCLEVALHLDHGDNINLISKCLKAGYSSIMFDGSHYPYMENIESTKKIVDLCHLFGVPVEGELGAIGGKIDAVNIDLAYTKPNIALDFVRKTSVDSLAVAIGTAHGIYKNTPKLDYARCNEIRNAVDVPLVLHGASGLSFEQVRECIKNGICKVNYATELRVAYTKAVKEYCNNHPENFDPKKYGIAAMKSVSDVVLEKLKTVNSIGRSCMFSPKLVVFDFDGTIVDSEKIYQDAWVLASKSCGYELSIADALKLRSCDSSVAKDIFPNIDIYNSVRSKRKELMRKYGFDEFFELKPGIIDTLKFLKRIGMKTIIASSSMVDIIENHLVHYDIKDYFFEVLSVKDISRGKPYPDIYYSICRNYDVSPEDVLVIEDSPNGVISSSTAGCRTVMIPDLSEPDENLCKKIDVVLPDASFINNIFK